MAAVSLSRSLGSLSYQRAMKLAAAEQNKNLNKHPLPSSSSSSSSSSSPFGCLCAPTSHPGSYRCNLHRNTRTTVALAGSGSGSGSSRTTTSAAAILPPSSVRTSTSLGRCWWSSSSSSPAPRVRTSNNKTPLGAQSSYPRRVAVFRALVRSRNFDAYTSAEKDMLRKSLLGLRDKQPEKEKQETRKQSFKPRPTRLSAMSKAGI